MINWLRNRGLFWPTLFAIPSLGVLIILGNWQWDRMHWKQELLQDLEAAEKAAPIRMQAVPGPGAALTEVDLAALRFRRITVNGVFEHAKEMHVWAPSPSGPAWSVVTPLRLQSVAADAAGSAEAGSSVQIEANANANANARATHVLVIRGVVADAEKSPERRTEGQVKGPQPVTGRVRLDQPNEWANEPNLDRNEWFSRDLKLMATRLREANDAPVSIAPFFIEAEQQIGGQTAPRPQLQSLTLTNRHLEYALTWWALAATLVGVFAAYVWSRIRQAAPKVD